MSAHAVRWELNTGERRCSCSLPVYAAELNNERYYKDQMFGSESIR